MVSGAMANGLLARASIPFEVSPLPGGPPHLHRSRFGLAKGEAAVEIGHRGPGARRDIGAFDCPAIGIDYPSPKELGSKDRLQRIFGLAQDRYLQHRKAGCHHRQGLSIRRSIR